jgi:hypothetical protein
MNIPEPIDWNLEITPTFSDVYTSLETEKDTAPEIPETKENISKKKNVKIPTLTFTKSFKQEYFKPLQHS